MRSGNNEQVTERELGALEAIAGSAILERFGIEAELGEVLRMLNSGTPDAFSSGDPDPREIAFGACPRAWLVAFRKWVANVCRSWGRNLHQLWRTSLARSTVALTRRLPTEVPSLYCYS